MSEYSEVEQPFCSNRPRSDEPCVIVQGCGVPNDAALRLCDNFQQWLLPAVFDGAGSRKEMADRAPADVNELTGERDPVAHLIDFHTHEKIQFCWMRLSSRLDNY